LRDNTKKKYKVTYNKLINTFYDPKCHQNSNKLLVDSVRTSEI